MTAQALQSPRMALGSDGAASRAAGEIGAGQDGPSPPSGQAPEELVEVQLRAILEATQTSAGAVCLFDQHQELLRLAVEIGLSDEGCRRLRSVRRGAATTWDMPLHSLLNRRVYLIESAAKNRYVPPLVDDIALVRAVACVPLYDGSTPVGSLILVAMAPRTFGERQIRLLEQPVRELVSHIGSMRKRVSIAAPVRTGRPSLSATALPPAAASVVGPSVPGVKVAPGSGGGGAVAASSSIQAAVDRARTELERLRARLTEADEATATERKRVETLEHEQQTLRTERDGLAETLAARTSEVGSLGERVAALEATLEEARRSEAVLRSEVEHASGAVASEGANAAETLTARLAELEATNEELRRHLGELEAADAAARAEIARLTADVESRSTTAADVEARAAALAADCEALRSRLAAAEVTHAQSGEAESRQAAALAEMESRHAAALAELETRHAAALAEVEARAATAAEWEHRCQALDGELGATRTMAGSHTERIDVLAREHAERETELSAAREREATLARRIEELESALARTNGELERMQAEDVQLRDGFAHLESLIQTEVDTDTPPAADTADGTTTFEVVELDDGGASLDDITGTTSDADGLVIEEVEATPPPEPPAPAVVAAASPPEGLLVVDIDACWTAAARGIELDILAPGTEPPADARPERMLVNLAAPHALTALTALREAGITAPAFGCIAIPGQQGRGLLIGRLELAARPIDPDALLAGLPGVFNRGTRVVTAGADVDGLISLRQALARLGVSVSMAWDAKQAADLLAMVHPDVAIIDLELPPKDGCALVARMGLMQPSPLTVVIPKGTDTAATFAAALAHPELGRMTIPAQEILARVLAMPLKVATRR